jgi:tRNA pseudouridine55 synthase
LYIVAPVYKPRYDFFKKSLPAFAQGFNLRRGFGRQVGGHGGTNGISDREINHMTGFLLINKPKEITSFQCVNHIKKIINARKNKIKVGHAGTLDPFATGLLIICVGREATRELTNMLTLDKAYLVKAKMGELTDTLDLTGKIIEKIDKIPTKKEIERAITSLGHEYIQTPPIYSALKHKGQPIYKLAREKKLDQEELEKIVKEKSRTVKLHEIKLISYKAPFFTFNAHVSKGTYIRSLANDIAKQAGSCATTHELERTKIGDISLDNAIPLNKIQTVEDVEKNLLKKEVLL